MPNYNGDLFDAADDEVRRTSPSYSWVGQSDDPFFLDLRVFDLLYGANLSEAGDDTLAGFNVNTFALQVPTKDVTRGPDDVDRSASGARRRVRACGSQNGRRQPDVHRARTSRSRAWACPLVNEVVVPGGR